MSVGRPVICCHIWQQCGLTENRRYPASPFIHFPYCQKADFVVKS